MAVPRIRPLILHARNRFVPAEVSRRQFTLLSHLKDHIGNSDNFAHLGNQWTEQQIGSWRLVDSLYVGSQFGTTCLSRSCFRIVQEGRD